MYCLVETRAFLPCSGGARSLCMSANKCGTTISKAARWSGSQHCGDCAPRTCWRWVRDGVASSRKGSGCYRRNFFFRNWFQNFAFWCRERQLVCKMVLWNANNWCCIEGDLPVGQSWGKGFTAGAQPPFPSPDIALASSALLPWLRFCVVGTSRINDRNFPFWQIRQAFNWNWRVQYATYLSLILMQGIWRDGIADVRHQIGRTCIEHRGTSGSLLWWTVGNSLWWYIRQHWCRCCLQQSWTRVRIVQHKIIIF